MSNVRILALTVAAGLLAVFPGQTAQAQLPLPRLQSVFPPGGQAGQNVDITVAGSDFEGVNALWFDHPGLRAFHLKGLTFRVAIAPGTPPGLHDVRAVSHLGISNPRVFLVGEWPESNEIEPNNQPDQARDLPLNTVLNGSVTATDIDCFRFDGHKGQRLFLELWAARIESRLNAVIRVYDPQGKEIVEGHADYAADPFLDLTLPADGRYTIKLHDVIYAGSNEYSYRLALHEGPRIDAILPAAALPGVANRFTLLGRKLGGEPCSELLVEGHPLEAKEVTLVTSGSNGEPAGASPGLELVPALAATRKGFPFQAWGERGKSNPVFVALAEHPAGVEQEPNNDGAHAQRVSLPCMVAGSFGKLGDTDLYRFSATKGQVWWVEVQAERLGSAADPTFLIQRVDDKGATQDVASGDDLPDIGAATRFPTSSVDASVRWQVPDSGTYQVELSDLYSSQRGDPRLTYQLVIRPEKPDFSLFVVPANTNQVEALTVRAGGRGLAYVVAARHDGFNRPIQVEAVELPPGVSCDPIVIGPGQVMAPIVFTAQADAKPNEGAVRLLGRGLSPSRKDQLDYVKGAGLQPELEHTAVAANLTWPPAAPQGVPIPTAARLTHGFVMAVRESAAFQTNVHPTHWDIAPGGTVELSVDIVRRPGFTEAVQLTTTDLPPNAGPASATIAKDQTTAQIKLPIPANVPPGTYTILIQGTGPFPFNKDPNAKDKPNVNVTDPSNPITITIRK